MSNYLPNKPTLSGLITIPFMVGMVSGAQVVMPTDIYLRKEDFDKGASTHSYVVNLLPNDHSAKLFNAMRKVAFEIISNSSDLDYEISSLVAKNFWDLTI